MNKLYSTGFRLPVYNLIFIVILFFFYASGARGQDTLAFQSLSPDDSISIIPTNGEFDSQSLTSTECQNSDFSLGSFTNWSGCFGKWCNNVNPNQTRCFPGIYTPFNPPCNNAGQPWYNNPTGGHFSIQNPGQDPCINALAKVFPGDAHSALIGSRACNDGQGGYVDQLTYQITYDTNNSFFIYRCAVVLANIQDPTHNTKDRRPRFTFQINDHATGQRVDTICGFYDLWPGDGITVWQNGSNNYLWKDWSTIGVDFNALSGVTPGQLLDVVFTVHDCAFTAHTGYAYISAFCGAITIQTSLCEGQDSAVLTAPPGFTHYLWSDGDTTRSTTVPAVEGAIQHCTVTALNGCSVDIINILHYTQIHAGFMQTLNCAQRPSSFTDTTWVSQNQVTSWRWFFGDPTSGAADSSHLKNPTHSFTAAGNYNITLISYSTEGCSDTIVKPVTIDSLPDVSDTSHYKIICSHDGTDITLTSNVSGTLFTWTATATSPLITGFSNQTIPVSYLNQYLVNNDNKIDSVIYNVVPHNATCAGDDTNFYVAVYPHPNLTNVPLIKSICDSSFTNIHLLSNVTGTEFTWTCSASSGNLSGYLNNTTTPDTLINQFLINSGITYDTVTYHIVPHAYGCNGDTTNYKVVVKPLPGVPAPPSGPTPVCQGITGITYSVNPVPNATQYIWSVQPPNAGTIIGNSQNVIINWSAGFSGIANIYVKGQNACVTGNSSLPLAVTVNPRPHVTNNPMLDSICSKDTTNINLTANVVGTVFSWNPTLISGNVTGFAPGSGSQIKQQLINNGPGNGLVQYTISPSYLGCSGPDTNFFVTILALPVPTITGSSSVCLNTSSTYTTETGMSNYTWNLSGGGIISSGNGTPSLTIVWNSAGLHTVSVTYQDIYQCWANVPTTHNVQVFPLPVPTVSGPQAVCQSSQGTYSTEPGMTGYQWTITGGTIFAGAGTNTIQVNWTTVGNQTLTINYINGNNCTAASPTSYSVTVEPLPVPTITGPAAVCTGLSGSYTTEAGMSGYAWIVSAGGTITSGAGTNAITVLWSTVGAQTISINYAFATGCIALNPTVKNITVNPLPTPTITGNNSICNNTSQTYTTEGGMSNYSWIVPAGGTITAGNGTNVITVLWSIAGVYNISVNYNNVNGCTAVNPTTYSITVHLLPVPTISGPPAVCQSSHFNYSTEPGMTGYLWTITGGTILTGGGTNTIQVDWTTVGIQTLTVNYTDGNTCTATTPTSYSVTVEPLPVPTVTGPAAVCAGLSGTYTTEAGMSGYSWAVSAGGTITSGAGTNAITVLWSTVGAQTVSVNYAFATGCMALVPTIKDITVNSLPTPTITGNNSVCNNTSQTYTTEGGMSNYSWIVPAGGAITAGNGTNVITVLWSIAGAYNISVNYNNANGCTAVNPTSYIITVHALPVPTVSGPGAMCLNNTGTYSTEASMNNYSWTVSSGGIIILGAGSNTVQINWTGIGNQTITVTYTDANGCNPATPTTYNVNINILPTPTITGSNAVCAGLSATYTTESGMASYTWSVTAGGTITSGSGTNVINVLWNTVGPQTVSVNYVVGTGCTAPSPTDYNVTVNPLPTPTITGNNNVCNTSSHVYTTETGMSNYTWVVPAGGTITAGAGTNSITVNWTIPGVYTISINYFNAFNCTAVNPMTMNVTVHALPVPTISGPSPVCQSSSGTYVSEALMTNYQWVVTGGTITSGLGTNSIQVIWTTVGNQTITVNYIDGNNCTATFPTSYSVTVNPLPTPTITGPVAVCSGLTGIYTTEAGYFNYTWTISAGGTIVSGAGTNSITVLWTTVGAQTVNINYAFATGCTALAPTIKNVIVNSLPVPTISGNNIACQNTSHGYTTEPGMTGYSWVVPPSGTITAGAGTNAITVLWNAPGNFTISVNYTNGNNCTAVNPSTYNITVNVAPVPSISGPNANCVTHISNYITEAGMTNYQWTVTGGTITAGIGTNTITVLWNTVGPQTMTTTYIDINGCVPLIVTSKNITVNALPVPVISGSNSVCEQQSSVSYSTPNVIGHTFSWRIAGGAITSGTGTNAITVTWGVAGTGTLKVIETIQATGCSDSASYSVTINPIPVPVISGSNAVCELSTQTYSSPFFVGHSYNWTITGGAIQAGQGTFQIQVLWGVAGTATLNVTETILATGCSHAAPVYTVSLAPYPLAAGPITGPTSLCETSNNVVYSVPPILYAISYTWTYSGTGVTIMNNGSSITVNFAAGATNGTLAVHGINNCGPGASSNLAIQVNPLPIVSYQICNDPITITSAQNIELKGGIPLGGIYAGTGVNAGIFYPGLAGPGNHIITYTYTNTWGCISSFTNSISVISTPGFVCGNNIIDVRDLQQYPTTLIGGQCWMGANLNYGNVILAANVQRDNCIPEKYCFSDTPGNCSTQGGLYQWDEIMQFANTAGRQGLCPPGWHIPSENDWNTLFNFYVSAGFSGSPIKPGGFAGFNAFLWGAHFENTTWSFNNFATLFWGSTMDGPDKAWAHGVNSFNPSVCSYPNSRSNAYFVRCIKD